MKCTKRTLCESYPSALIKRNANKQFHLLNAFSVNILNRIFCSAQFGIFKEAMLTLNPGPIFHHSPLHYAKVPF